MSNDDFDRLDPEGEPVPTPVEDELVMDDAPVVDEGVSNDEDAMAARLREAMSALKDGAEPGDVAKALRGEAVVPQGAPAPLPEVVLPVELPEEAPIAEVVAAVDEVLETEPAPESEQEQQPEPEPEPAPESEQEQQPEPEPDPEPEPEPAPEPEPEAEPEPEPALEDDSDPDPRVSTIPAWRAPERSFPPAYSDFHSDPVAPSPLDDSVTELHESSEDTDSTEPPLEETAKESTSTVTPSDDLTDVAPDAVPRPAAPDVWAAVLDRSPHTSTMPSAPNSPAETPPAPRDDLLTGEEVALDEPSADTGLIVGVESDEPLETSQIERVSATSAPRIPPVLHTDETPAEEEAPAPPSSIEDTHEELPPVTPLGSPRDVLENRRESRIPQGVQREHLAIELGAGIDQLPPHVVPLGAQGLEPEALTMAGAAAAAATESTIAAAAEAEASRQVKDARAREDIEHTGIRRRSLMAPVDTEDHSTEAQWKPRVDEREETTVSATPATLDDAIFEGSTVIPNVPSRVPAHVWSLVLTLVLTPVAWYALADAGARMTLAPNNPMITGSVNIAAIAELLGGIVALLLVFALTIRSSLGAYVVGAIVTIVGAPWVLAPGWTARMMLPAMEWLTQWNVLGANLAHHLQSSGYSGRMLITGIALMCVAMVSHKVRRRGRAEEALRSQVERVNPEGAYLSRMDRRRATQSAKDN